MVPDFAGTVFFLLFDHFLGMSVGKAQNHPRTIFRPFLFLGPLWGHVGHEVLGSFVHRSPVLVTHHWE